MQRRNFLYLTGLGAAAAMLPPIPVIGNPIDPLKALEPVDVALKKKMADVALNAAKSKGATYTDVRIGRYLNQYVITREDKVENIVNTES
ncbi:MAG: TldD/PmbA family protein, partial [Mucilaginibacter polytrichastri]|nr:TldD/PmbA family protein [Mucilaginibacter polytrichastri]